MQDIPSCVLCSTRYSRCPILSVALARIMMKSRENRLGHFDPLGRCLDAFTWTRPVGFLSCGPITPLMGTQVVGNRDAISSLCTCHIKSDDVFWVGTLILVPGKAGGRYVRLRASSLTYGQVIMVIIDGPGRDHFSLLYLQTERQKLSLYPILSKTCGRFVALNENFGLVFPPPGDTCCAAVLRWPLWRRWPAQWQHDIEDNHRATHQPACSDNV